MHFYQLVWMNWLNWSRVWIGNKKLDQNIIKMETIAGCCCLLRFLMLKFKHEKRVWVWLYQAVKSPSVCLLSRCSSPPFGPEAPARSTSWLWAEATCSAGRGPPTRPLPPPSPHPPHCPPPSLTLDLGTHRRCLVSTRDNQNRTKTNNQPALLKQLTTLTSPFLRSRSPAASRPGGCLQRYRSSHRVVGHWNTRSDDSHAKWNQRLINIWKKVEVN